MKPKWKSATLWVFLVVAVAAEAFKQLELIMPETGWVAQGLSITAWVLRFKTSQPII
jgi:hypothetical protein